MADLDPKDRAELAAFKRYLRGEMGEKERRAYTGMDSPAPSDLQRVAQIHEITEGRGTLQQAREASGLSLGQAVRVTGIAKDRLLAIEAGAEPIESERQTLCLTYDVLGWVPAEAVPRG